MVVVVVVVVGVVVAAAAVAEVVVVVVVVVLTYDAPSVETFQSYTRTEIWFYFVPIFWYGEPLSENIMYL